MEMKFGLQMRQSQRLVMTPKLQQALKLLQVPTLELQQILKQEILQNPMLEEVDEVEEDDDELGADAERLEAEDAESAEKQATDEDGDFDKDPDESWDDYLNDGFDLGYKRSEDQPEEFFERVPVAQTSFVEKLLEQLRVSCTDETELLIGEYLIGSLDERGYLTCSLDEVANTFQVEMAVVEK